MSYARELVRCPECGSRKIKQVSINGPVEAFCYCRGEAMIMESLSDRTLTLSGAGAPAQAPDLPSKPAPAPRARFAQPRGFFTQVAGFLPRRHALN